MPTAEQTRIDVGDVALTQADSSAMRLGDLAGVQLVVLMRHRH